MMRIDIELIFFFFFFFFDIALIIQTNKKWDKISPVYMIRSTTIEVVVEDNEPGCGHEAKILRQC
jgi:hypothetical protein